jgi:hypothetical protein
MNIVFGNQVGTLNQYSTPGSALEEDQFTRTINRNRYVMSNRHKQILSYDCRLTWDLVCILFTCSLASSS